MATGLSRTLEGGHDVIYDYCCTTCDRKNLNAEALFYCKDCRKLFCEGCEQYHDKFTEGHNVLGRNEVAKWGDIKPVTSSLMCEMHPGKELEMYCGDHDRVCCHTCISVNHRTCKQVKPVSEVSKGTQKKSEFKSFLSGASKTQSRLKTLHDRKEDNIKMLEKARGEVTTTFKNMRRKLHQIVDQLEEDSTTELDRHECFGIAYHNDQLYVGSMTALYVYNLSGQIIKKIYEDVSREGRTVYRFSLSDDGSRIYVTNINERLLRTLNSSGHQLSTFSEPELNAPKGVCVADNGSVFACGSSTHTVLQVDREGKRKMATLVTQNDGVYYPQSLCYDRKTKTLLVGQGQDNLLALQLK